MKTSRITIIFPLVLAIVLVAGILVGRYVFVPNQPHPNFGFHSIQRYDKLGDILNYIAQDYVDSIDRTELTETSIKQMLKDLDPHSQYIPAREFDNVNDALLGSFEGIGIQFRIVEDSITVIQTILGGPSEKIGLRAGDRIVMIDDSTVAGNGLKNNDAIRLLKGPRGTKVNVDIFRRGFDELLDFTITRDIIPTYSMDIAYMLNETVGYIKLNKFAATTYEEFRKGMRQLIDEGMQELILDLRGNTGGYLNAAINISDEFLPEGELIVYTEGNNRPRRSAYATNKGLWDNEPVIVLIDEGSASASEIVAGALQDNDRGTIIGRRSFGKGLVQEQLDFPDGSGLRLTVARYHTPTGRCIQKPYDEGTEDYYHEFYDRFVNGELISEDSIKFNDSLVYTTPKGKKVYGGGGIMPDKYVPVDYNEDEKFYNEILNKGLMFQFAFDYTDANRGKLETRSGSYRTKLEGNGDSIRQLPDETRSLKDIDNELYGDFMDWLKDKNLKNKPVLNDHSRRKIKTMLRAYIARNVWDNDGFYPVYHEIDTTLKIAVSSLNTPSDAN